MYAVVRLRGSVNMNKKIKDAFRFLNLKRVNHCVLIEENPTNKGMLKKVENWITWGEVNDEVATELKKKRAGPLYRLSPPTRGLRSIKLHFPRGDVGYRGEKINELLKRMI